MKIAVPKEKEIGEMRVALVPDIVARLTKKGFQVLVETQAGEAAHFHDQSYIEAGAEIIADAKQLWQQADILLKVAPPGEFDGEAEINQLRAGAILISFLDPLRNPEKIQQIAQRQITAFSMELIPRSTRAQSMDALSSQANIAGHKATLLAAAHLPRMFPMMTTAAGTIPPAKVLVLGAGVAGLQAIATARRLGAVVEAFDIRPTVKEEVQSVGAKFIEIPLQEETNAGGGYAKEISNNTQEIIRQVLTEHIKKADVVITTAQVQGKKAPLLVTEEMIAQMKRGSVIVDLAAEQGGNCAHTEAGKDVQYHGVTIIGPVNLPASLPIDSSQMYSKNLQTLVEYLVKDGKVQLNFDDDIIHSACVTHAGEIMNARIRDLLPQSSVISH
ncbi:Re/Si-specific NAD(P)(+) transhydrogenase subunit alpha [Gloeothece verrucosa]|uniref:NAD(P) transhydrogenase subunit alpha part 1 n=1 Tax=Gloeothece verrucosa (strain PCC 7822) TaxID=497965 RepID=E0UCH2_GLOV7|nr:Re/Si-specific NAD(P)(+) transhydrogenase subunit alpha [Gloeothece verrucosa]ADN14043.1 NAD(P)(+) transhydrogenase (AB-specific) [Gloeothece verrucosa PCC 7822]